MPIFYDPMPVATTTFKSDSTTGGTIPTKFDVALYRPFGKEWGPLKLLITLRINRKRCSGTTGRTGAYAAAETGLTTAAA